MAQRTTFALIVVVLAITALPARAHELRICVTALEEIATGDRGELSVWANYRIRGEMRSGRLDLSDTPQSHELVPLLTHDSPMFVGVQLTFTPSGLNAALVGDLSGCDPVAGSPKEFPLPNHGPTSISANEPLELLLDQLKGDDAPPLALLLLDRPLTNTLRRVPATIRITTFERDGHGKIDHVALERPSETSPEPSTADDNAPHVAPQGCQIGAAAPSAGLLFWLAATLLLFAARRRRALH